MAVTKRRMQGVTPRQVFDVLRDGRSYQVWVVGTRAIREVDPGWPSPGTRIHYTVGHGPLRKDDATSAVAYEPHTRLELEAHAWPVGTARIVLTAEPVEDGALVTIDEAPRRGPARVAHPLLAVALRLRNVETLRRLEAQARLR